MAFSRIHVLSNAIGLQKAKEDVPFHISSHQLSACHKCFIFCPCRVGCTRAKDVGSSPAFTWVAGDALHEYHLHERKQNRCFYNRKHALGTFRTPATSFLPGRSRLNRDDPDVFRIVSFFERGGTDGEKGTMGMGGTIEEHTTRRRRRWRWRRDRSRRRCDAARSPLPVETRKGSERTFLHRFRRASRLPGRHRRGGKRRRGTGMEKDRHDVEFSQV